MNAPAGTARAVGERGCGLHGVGGNVPPDIPARFTPEQVERLERVLASRSASHVFDYRVSTSFFGSGFYLAIFAGREQRSQHRLRQEGQRRPFSAVLFELLAVCAAVTVLASLAVGTSVIGMYVVKCLAGIDLMQDHFFLHDWFFWQ